MYCCAEIKDVEELEPTNILPQTSFWARIKNGQGFIPGGFHLTVSEDLMNPSKNQNQNIHGDLLVLISYVNSRYCFAYVPYGPKLEPGFENHGVFLEELSEALRPFLPSNCVFIRYDLMWESQWAEEDEFFDEGGNWLGPPPVHTQELRLNFNTNNWNLKKSPGDLLPKNTFFINLRLKENDLLYGMRFNTRYNIRQAYRKGVEIREYGLDRLDKWYKIYCETAIRNQMAIQEKDYFSALITNQDHSRRGVKVSLLMAEHDGKSLAAMFLALSNKRGTYLFGASSSEERELMPSYALQWEAIKKAKNCGCLEYDMFGCAPNLDQSHPLHGVHIYKKGFGGKIYHRMGCWDYPYFSEEYELLKAVEMNG